MDRTLFAGGQVFDGVSMRSGLGVLVEDRRIGAVELTDAFEGFAGTRIETAGHTLLPGLIDAHVHLAFDASDAPDGMLDEAQSDALVAAVAERAAASLRVGFVALRDCGGPGTAEFVFRDRVRRGEMAGPLVQACGRMIRKAINGFGDGVAYEAGDRDVPDAVAAVADTGADFINIMTTIDATVCAREDRPAYANSAVEAGVAAAAQRGLRTISNAQCAADVRTVAAAGVASVEQGSLLDEAAIAAMLENDVVLVPIFLARHNMDEARVARGGSVQAIEAAAKLAEHTRDAVRRFSAAGGTVALGTDCGAPGSFHGANCDELSLMVAAGLTPTDVLRAATRNGATLMGLDDVGRIDVGARASLLLVEGDPSRDIAAVANLENHRGVWHDGDRVAGT
jgi:imidazolonepropionase-like amidohydrolase